MTTHDSYYIFLCLKMFTEIEEQCFESSVNASGDSYLFDSIVART